MNSPVMAEGDAKGAESVIEGLAGLKMETVIEDNPKDYKDFGLEDPALKIMFTSTKGEESLWIGDDNPSGTLVYGKTGKEPRIFAFSPDQKRRLNKSVYDLRDKTILPLKKDRVKKVSFSKGEFRLDAFLEEDKTWKVTQPFRWRADKEKLEGIIQAVKDSEIKEFVSEKPDGLGEFGLEKPLAVLKFFLAEGDELETGMTLWIGKKVPDQNRYFAKREGTANVFLMDDRLMNKFPEDAEDFRDNKLLAIENSERIVKLRFSGEQTVVVEKDSEGDWTLLEPEEAKADLFETSQWVDKVAKIEIKEFPDIQDRNLSEFGLDSPIAIIERWEREAEASGKILIGSEVRDGRDRYVSLAGAPGVFTISGETYRNLLVTGMKLRDKRLVFFDTEEIEKIEIHKGNKRVELKRSGDSWKVKPSGKELEGNLVRSLLWDIIDLAFSDISGKGETDLNPFGLAKPSLSIKILKKNGKKAGEIYLGERLADKGDEDKVEGSVPAARYYAMNGSKKEVYEVETDIVDKIDSKFKDWGIEP